MNPEAEVGVSSDSKGGYVGAEYSFSDVDLDKFGVLMASLTDPDMGAGADSQALGQLADSAQRCYRQSTSGRSFSSGYAPRPSAQKRVGG